MPLRGGSFLGPEIFRGVFVRHILMYRFYWVILFGTQFKSGTKPPVLQPATNPGKEGPNVNLAQIWKGVYFQRSERSKRTQGIEIPKEKRNGFEQT
jgi:hypothetical protein